MTARRRETARLAAAAAMRVIELHEVNLVPDALALQNLRDAVRSLAAAVELLADECEQLQLVCDARLR